MDGREIGLRFSARLHQVHAASLCWLARGHWELWTSLRLQFVATAYFHCAHHTVQANLQVGSCLVTVAMMVTDSSSLQAVEETIASQLKRSWRCGRAALNWSVQERALRFSWNSAFHTIERSELGKEVPAFSLAFYLSWQGRGMLRMGAELLFHR